MNISTDITILIFVFAALTLFIFWFTGSLRQNPVDTEMKRAGGKLRRMVSYSYGIAFGALAFTVYPFFTHFSGNLALQEGAFVIVRGCVEPSENQRAPLVVSCREKRHQWLVSIGGAMTGDESLQLVGEGGNYILHGGLSVPLYLIVIALLGGAVSMTRRVPEIQRLCWAYILVEDRRRRSEACRQNPDDILDDNEHAISPEKAREHFIFQIMQLVSAPVIALVAFELLSPGSVALTVGIAFVSGFTSEQVLTAIRNAAGKFIAKTDTAQITDRQKSPSPPKELKANLPRKEH